MVKNYLLWFVFSILLLVTSVTACLAGQQAEKNSAKQKQSPLCWIQHKESASKEVKEQKEEVSVTTDSIKEDSQEAAPSILNTNFIFYIIYKFKFMDAKSDYKDDNEDKAALPILTYTRSIFIAINSLFEKKF
ncbi:MAG: hypothetical protein M3512_13230 [Bacteroidota bacterium]|nr:hypothetical protein [Bacteroidota bacterium]